MRKIITAALLAVGMVVGLAGPALAHHVVDVDVEVSCEGYAGEAVLNVFGGHKYRVTAPGFDTGTLTEYGQSHNVTVPFSGTATSGVVRVEIMYPDGRLEDSATEGFELEESCDHRYRVVAGMPRYRGDVFEAPDGLGCSFEIRPHRWLAQCADHDDIGELRARTYVRLRDLTDGSVVVLLDRR